MRDDWKQAQPAGRRPLDGGVRALVSHSDFRATSMRALRRRQSQERLVSQRSHLETVRSMEGLGTSSAEVVEDVPGVNQRAGGDFGLEAGLELLL